MMAMTIDAHAPEWRNFAVWSAAGAAFYILAALAGTAILTADSVGAISGAMLRSARVTAALGLGVLFSAAVIGFTNRKRPVSLRSLRNFVIRDGVAMAAFLLVLWGIMASARAGMLSAMGSSERVAAGTGALLIAIALLGIFVTVSARTGVHLIDDEVAAEDMRDRGRLFLCSFTWMIACGLLLAGLSVAGPEGLLPPAAALAGALVLVAVMAVLTIAAWRLSDELGRTLSHETGNMAFYLIWAIGSGWAMLAHLGFVAAPAPLDWLTLFIVLLFAAAFIATGRRKLLTR
jgi:hypothetical protein